MDVTSTSTQQLKEKSSESSGWNKNVKKIILIAATSLILIVSASTLFVILWVPEVTPVKKNNNTRHFSYLDADYIYRDNQIFERVGEQERLFMYNVPPLKKLRRGPEFYDLHFKTSGDYDNHSFRCIRLAPVPSPAPTNYPSPPPSQVPWDFGSIGRPHTIKACSGGFLENSEYFAYARIKGKSLGEIIIEDKEESSVAIIPLSEEIAHSFSLNEEEPDSYRFYFPHSDTHMYDDKITLAFYHVVISIDLHEKEVHGHLLTEVEENGEFTLNHGIIPQSYWLVSQKNNPVALIESAWEGPPFYNALIDYSGDNLQIEDLSKYDSRVEDWFDFRHLEWIENGLKVTLYNETDVTTEVEDIVDQIDYRSLNNLSEEEYAKLFETAETQAKQRLSQKYNNVTCTLSPGRTVGCFSAHDITTFEYSAGGNLRAVQ